MKAIIKETLKKTLTAYPGLKRNVLYHELSSLRDRLHSRPDPTRSKHPELIEALMRDGVVTVEGFASPEQVQACRQQLEPHFQAAKDRTHPSRVLNDQYYYRLTNADKLVPAAEFFYESPLVWDVVRAYMSPKAATFRREAELRCTINDDVSAEDLFHFDTWHPNFKAFLYLTDVEHSNGPFRYLIGSHHKAAWRRKRELEFECDGQGGSFGHFFPGEVEHLQKQYGLKERVFTAKAGTLILGDFRGLHRGTPVRGGQRILLNQVFNIFDWKF